MYRNEYTRDNTSYIFAYTTLQEAEESAIRALDGGGCFAVTTTETTAQDDAIREEAFHLIMMRINRKLKQNRNSKRGDKIRALKRRIDLRRYIEETAVDGKVFVEESGMDCDCVQYSGHIHKIPATLEALDALEDDIGEWADGPFHLRVIDSETAQHTQAQSRDLAMEAHEDGHPHIVYPSY